MSYLEWIAAALEELAAGDKLVASVLRGCSSP